MDHNEFDHTEFDRPHTRAVYIQGSVLGVIDHNHVISSGGQRGAIVVEHPKWGGGDHGDGSWADASHWGTDRFVFIEDNVFDGPPDGHMDATDATKGGRFVFRYNELTNAKVGAHGTDSSGRDRGGRAFEVYGNVATHSPDWPMFVRLRSGTALIHGNTVRGFNQLVALTNYRSTTNYRTWKSCDGSYGFDVNDGIVYDSGTHNGLAGSVNLTDTTKNWQSNFWSRGGFSVRNTTRSRGGYAISNTAHTIRIVGAQFGPKARFYPGDRYQILRTTLCMDAPGSGKGDLLSGNDPAPKVWPHQVRDPVYVWENVHNDGEGAAAATSFGKNPHIVEGRDYFNDIPKPGYAPFVYPHPLVSDAIVSGADTIFFIARTALSTLMRRGVLLVAPWDHMSRTWDLPVLSVSRSRKPWFIDSQPAG